LIGWTSALPLDTKYSYPTTAGNGTAYILDTGIRTSHTDFGGRASVGFDAVGDGKNGQDCQGHGTHVAGTVGGTKYGVAKQVRLVAVRVLNCQGSGTSEQIISGINWVTHNARKPAVVNMSLGGGANSATDQAVRNSIASGVTYAVAAGNGNAQGVHQDACKVSPARVPEAITVGAVDKTDTKTSFSNYGTCLDIFAPGVSITSATFASDTSTGPDEWHLHGDTARGRSCSAAAGRQPDRHPHRGPDLLVQHRHHRFRRERHDRIAEPPALHRCRGDDAPSTLGLLHHVRLGDSRLRHGHEPRSRSPAAPATLRPVCG
jgi:subtilisin family serine protease